MKKCTLGFLCTTVFMLILLNPHYSFSQKKPAPSNPNQINLNTGATLSGVLLKRLFETSDSVRYSLDGKAPMQLTYQRDFNHWFRLGLMFSSQRYKMKFDQYIDQTGVLQTGNFNATFKRRNLFIKPTLVKSWDQFELYTGIRLGIGFWKVDVDSDKLSLKFINRINGLVLPSGGGFVGAQTFMGEHFGINAEINLGAPHLFSGGFSYRF